MPVTLLRGDCSTLQASVVAPGLTEEAFREALGWEVRFQEYRYDGGRHLVSEQDAEQLRLQINSRSGNPRFWGRFVGEARRRAGELAAATRALAGQDLSAGLTAFAAAAIRLIPFVASRGSVQSALEEALEQRIDQALGDAANERTGELLRELLASRRESEAAREVRSFYRIADAISRNQSVVDLIVDRSSPRALKTLAGEYPALHTPLLRHVDEYGWVRTRHFTLPPLTPKELVQRLQKVFLRWDSDTLAGASKPIDKGEARAILGFEPTDEIAEGLEVLEDLLGLRDLCEDALLHGQHQARDLFRKIALTLKCSREDVALLTVDELTAALSRSEPLPQEKIEARAAALPPAPVLRGQSVALGRAVGRIRVVASEGTGKVSLRFGDILVTGLSSPDHGGNPSIFPTRTEAAVPIEEAAGIVIDDGGLLSHAAMISREHGIPCVVGTERATSELANGKVVEVDATRGEGAVIPFEYL